MNHFSRLLAIALIAFASPAAAKVNIVTTITDLAAIANAVGGKYVKATSLTAGTRDPHFAVAKPSMIRRVHDADLLLLVGADLEIGWLPPLLQRARNARIQPGTNGYFDMAAVIPLKDIPTGPISRAMGDVHPKGNPHYWLDPRNGARLAVAIGQRLAVIDPAHAADYRKAAKAFVAELTSRLVDWRKQLAGLKGQPVIAYHNSMEYLADAFGFTIADEVEPKPGIAPSGAYLGQLLGTIRNRNIPLLIMEPFYEQRSAAFLHEKTGINVAVIPQSVGSMKGIKTYFDLFNGIVKTIDAALAAATPTTTGE